MNVVIDDHLLREVLLDGSPAWLRRLRGRGELYTTGSWYYRLCSALQASTIVGALSGPVADLPDDLRDAVVERVVRLPAKVGLLSLRELAWSASGLGRAHGLNLIAAEALASALAVDAVIATAEANLSPKLAAAAAVVGVRVATSP